VASSIQKTWSDEELMALPGDGKYELAGFLHVAHVIPGFSCSLPGLLD
jgi:hypothetical protein